MVNLYLEEFMPNVEFKPRRTFVFCILGFGFWVLGFGFWVLGFGQTVYFATPLCEVQHECVTDSQPLAI